VWLLAASVDDAMDQLELKQFAVAHWQDIAFGGFILVSLLRALFSRNLANELKRRDPSTWEALGRPNLFGDNSTRDILSFDWYVWARRYRNSETRKLRILGDLKFACSAAMWILALAIIVFGDLNRYNHLILSK
jgi:hypothetical protein